MLQVGQQSTFPKLLFIANRMKIEQLIEEGLVAGRGKRPQQTNGDGDGLSRDDMSLHLHGRELKTSRDSWRDVDQGMVSREKSRLMEQDKQSGTHDRRSSVMEELKRQSGIFFDDEDDDIEDSELSEEDTRAVENGPTKVG